MKMHRKQKFSGATTTAYTHRKPKRTKSLIEPVLVITRPMSHMGFQGARHMHPERLPTKQREKAVSLRLFDLEKETIENVQNLAETIKRLMIPSLNLKSVPDHLVDKLVNLEKLDLSHNSIPDGGLPDSMKVLEKLVELNLTDNRLTRVPASLKKLKCLSRLDLSYNNIESLKGLEKARRVQILVVDHNKLSGVFKDISHMKKLEVFRCSHNNLRDVGTDVRQLKSLKDMDLSCNKIVVLPTDVFMLPKLDALNASHNKITKVSSFNVRVHNKHWVSEVDLSENNITNFPGHLLQMSMKLDLSKNQIKKLDMNAMKQLERNQDQDLFVDDNPLTFPPPDVTGMRSILQYMHEARINATVYRGVKVVVLGSTKSGKTSLVQSLVDQQGRLVDSATEINAGVEAYDMRIDYEEHKAEQGKYLQFSIWDFCGDPFYLYPHYMFLEQPSIAVLTFNMKQYSSNKFDEMIGSWFDWMIAKTNRLVVLLVGTHSDLVSESRLKQITIDVKARLDTFRQHHENLIKKRIAKIDAIPEIKATHSDQLIALKRLLSCTETLQIQTDLIVTSAKEYVGYDQLRTALDELANNKKLFPDVMTVVPTFWVEVQNYIEEKGNTMIVPIMKYDDFFDEITDKFGMKRMMKNITCYLHETGRVIWFANNPVLSQYVFLRPSWLFELLRHVYRHDQTNVLNYETNDSFKAMGFSSTRFERYKKMLLEEGIMESDMLRGILGHLLPLDDTSPFNIVETLLIDAFQAGYPIQRRKDNTYRYNVDPDEDGNIQVTKILMPWLRKVDESNDCAEKWEKIKNRKKLVALLHFPKYMPPGLFEIISVRCQKKKKNNLKYLAHWGGGILAEHTEEIVLVRINYCQSSKGKGTNLKFEVRDNTKEDAYEDTPPSSMWTVLLPLLMEFEEVIKTYHGVLVERLMHCPRCEEPSFIGEWLTPADTQTLETKECDMCQEHVDPAYLVQPREKKRDRINDVLANLSKVRARRKAALIKGQTLQSMLLDDEDVVEEGGDKKDADAPAVGGRRRGGVLPPPDLSILALPVGLAVPGLGESGDNNENQPPEADAEEAIKEDNEKEEEEEGEDIDNEEPPSNLASDLAAFQNHLRMLATQANPDMQFEDDEEEEDDEEDELNFDDDIEEGSNDQEKFTIDGSTQTSRRR
ncbi:malignant fibrous histiocytoma-amplified sequence 1-like isoform X1 [Pecten maximus]|uniref:malignant fibrous histiocytoma-amplified sequence 1-like isoform X1 n=1 Tax=Pecten maximus TaxID=6579 RepID=UPI001458AC3C|nr:malignant fibrous histiocytoma-amplified sequence 1-like isoform X1 [Pecten maximus]XP_033759417.1 malignant fibrous histiocytoma-amplified sequence 1-like isoform X1 [Pecten maximus]XP_033759418.1 malignant fibrous histiocytoma-amplified sequence 1-like isoform X1 [Pecten maximus]